MEENSTQDQSSVQATQPSAQPVAAPNQTQKKPSAVYMIIAVFILLVLAGLGLYLYKHNTKQSVTQARQASQAQLVPSIQPTVTPVTSQNVDQVLQNTDNSVQQAINQANSDLQKVNNINTSQDNTNNL